jgi:hypothetical protein
VSQSTFPIESKRDILFLFDGSANIVGQFPAVRDFLYKIIDELNVKPDGTRVAVAQYSDDVKVESRFNEHPSKAEIPSLVKKMKIKTGKALNLGYALDYAQKYIFVKSAGSRLEDGVLQFLVLLVAGRSSDAVDGPASTLKQSGVVPFIFQAKNADPAELDQIVPSPAFILTAESLPKIGDLQPQIVNLLKSVSNGAPAPGMVHQWGSFLQPNSPVPELGLDCWLWVLRYRGSQGNGEVTGGFNGTKSMTFLSFFFVVLGLELRAYILTPVSPPLFVMGVFRDRVLRTICPGWL